MINSMKREKFDELYTPEEAVYPLLPYIPKGWRIWECADLGNSNITKVFKEQGYDVISTHINGGFDFLQDEPNFEFDVIITNPPYSLKNQFLKRAYELEKPFAFLLPITTLEGKFRGRLFRKYGVEILVLDKRINFLRNKRNVWYHTSWFCWKILPEQLIFVAI